MCLALYLYVEQYTFDFMPTNKKAQLRYEVLDQCFRDFNHKYTIDDLLDKVNDALEKYNSEPIQLRQLRLDIKYIRERGAEIDTVPMYGKVCYYRYHDPHYALYRTELSLEDLQELRSTLNMLSHYKSLQGNEWLEEVISSLECRFGIKPNTEKLIDFEKNDQLKGLNHLSALIDATVEHQTLEIDYCTYTGKERTFIFFPYYMKQYNGRWFVFGWDDERTRIVNLALDRIQHISTKDIPFRENDVVNFKVHFNNVIGVTVPTADQGIPLEKIILRFSSERFPYVDTKPMHRSQKKIGENTIQLTLRPTRELYQQIFSFIPDVEVLSPDWFREEIKKKIEENLKKYLSV